jgi:outer membrane receptor protein involved in Fe transport
MRYLHSLLLVFFCAGAAAAQALPTDEDLFFSQERASLEQLLNIKTSVASLIPRGLRETPGLVTVITAEDIKLSGARDLVDLLRLVPDFEFVVDVQGNLGLGVRGNSAIEGKVLLLWDGHIYNEQAYYTIQFDRFPVDQIERIEIIKGPGSVIYGGVGEVAVINIRTRSPGSLEGGRIYGGYGQMSRAPGARFGGLQFGRDYGDLKFSALAHFSDSQRSDRSYRDFSGGSYNMNGDSDLDGTNLNLFVQRKGLSLRFIADEYSQVERDHFGDILSTGATRIKFPVYSFAASNSVKAGENLTLELTLASQYSRPWLERDDHFPYDKTARKHTASVTAFYKPGDITCLMGGAEFTHDEIEVGAATNPDSRYPNGRTGARYDNLAFFAQSSLDLNVFNLTAGGRLDNHSQSGASFVPRLALTRLFDAFHFKAIYSGAYRAPSPENIRLTPSIKPERTTAAELEVGYKFSESLFLTANAFEVAIKDVILFSYDSATNTEDYVNFSRMETRGYGLGAKFRGAGHQADFGYSSYSAGKSRIPNTKTPLDATAALALPRHKAVLTSRLRLGEKLTVSPSVIYLSRRYGYYAAGATKAYDELTVANVYFHMRNSFVNGLDLGLGVNDLFGANYSYLQSYDGGHAPLPAASREIFLKAAYAF